jgi:hypothetical protein
VNRLLMSLTAVAAFFTAGCQDSGSSGEYVPFSQTAPVIDSTAAADSPPAKAQSVDTAATDTAATDTAATDTAASSTAASDTAASQGNPPQAAPATNPVDPVSSIPEQSTPRPGDSNASPPSATAPSELPTTGPDSPPAPLVTSTQTGLTGPADRPAIENTGSSEPRPIQLLIPNKRFRKERPSNALRVSYDDIDLLKVLNMEPVPPDAVSHFPEWLTQLDGQTVRIRGYMYPTFEATGLTSFTLARDNGICCFVRQPKIYDIISVTLAPGEVSDYIANRPFDVEGVFRIDPGADQTDLSRLYRIEQAKVLN